MTENTTDDITDAECREIAAYAMKYWFVHDQQFAAGHRDALIATCRKVAGDRITRRRDTHTRAVRGRAA